MSSMTASASFWHSRPSASTVSLPAAFKSARQMEWKVPVWIRPAALRFGISLRRRSFSSPAAWFVKVTAVISDGFTRRNSVKAADPGRQGSGLSCSRPRNHGHGTGRVLCRPALPLIEAGQEIRFQDISIHALCPGPDTGVTDLSCQLQVPGITGLSPVFLSVIRSPGLSSPGSKDPGHGHLSIGVFQLVRPEQPDRSVLPVQSPEAV